MITGRKLPALVVAALLMPGVFGTTVLAEPQGDITIRQDGERTVREYRLDGQLYAIEILDNGQRRVLLDTDGDGNFRRLATDAEITPPAWTQESP
ncbi:DUF2782 domain-containing protein [Kushneria sp. AK178]